MKEIISGLMSLAVIALINTPHNSYADSDDDYDDYDDSAVETFHQEPANLIQYPIHDRGEASEENLSYDRPFDDGIVGPSRPVFRNTESERENIRENIDDVRILPYEKSNNSDSDNDD